MVKFNPDEIKEIVTNNWEKKKAREAEELAALEAEIAALRSNKPGVKIDENVEKIVTKKKKLSFIERILEAIRKIFGGDKRKSKKQLKKESEQNNLLEENFTDLPKKEEIYLCYSSYV